MGILDEAIREHLDLKRAHGAPDEEVKRQEQEALGAARREASAEAQAPPPADAAPAAEAAPEASEPVAEPVTPADPAPAAEHPPEPDPEPPTQAIEPEPVPEPPAEEAAAPEPAPEPGADDDVLEDTPDFLQETPEHDRLWFEQKPPRDFNFDE